MHMAREILPKHNINGIVIMRYLKAGYHII